MNMVNVTITLSSDDIELLQKAVDNMNAWSASKGYRSVWTIENYLLIGVLRQAKADLDNWEKSAAK